MHFVKQHEIYRQIFHFFVDHLDSTIRLHDKRILFARMLSTLRSFHISWKKICITRAFHHLSNFLTDIPGKYEMKWTMI